MIPGHSKEPLDTLHQFGYNVLGGFISILTLIVPLSVVLPWTTTTSPTGGTLRTSQTSTKTMSVTIPDNISVNITKKSSTLFQ